MLNNKLKNGNVVPKYTGSRVYNIVPHTLICSVNCRAQWAAARLQY